MTHSLSLINKYLTKINSMNSPPGDHSEINSRIFYVHHGRNLVGDEGDMSLPLFYPRGTDYVLSPPLFDSDLILFC